MPRANECGEEKKCVSGDAEDKKKGSEMNHKGSAQRAWRRENAAADRETIETDTRKNLGRQATRPNITQNLQPSEHQRNSAHEKEVASTTA